MAGVGELEVMAFFVLFSILVIWALFWVVRLAVRYGTNDALRMNREWLTARDDHDTVR